MPSYVILPARHNADLQYHVKVFEVMKRKHLLAEGELRDIQCWQSQLMYSFHTTCVLSLHTQVPMPSTVLKAGTWK